MDTVRQQIIVRLVNKLGGLASAARRLGVRESILMRLIDGQNPVPDALMLKAIDLVLDDYPGGAAPADAEEPSKPIN